MINKEEKGGEKEKEEIMKRNWEEGRRRRKFKEGRGKGGEVNKRKGRNEEEMKRKN